MRIYRTASIILVTTLPLVGCATPGRIYNFNVPPGQQQYRLAMDKGACVARARSIMGTPPQPPQQNALGGTQYYSGEISSDNGQTSTFTGSVTSGNNNLIGAYEQGLHAGDYSREMSAWNQNFKQIYYGCLAQRGWVLLH